MNRYFKFVIIFITAILLVGCGNSKDEVAKDEKEKTVNCKLEKEDITNGYTLVSTYELIVEDELVTNNKIKEVITSSNADVLKYFEASLKLTYNNMSKNYGGYNYNVTNDGKKVEAITNIDYTKVNIDKLIEDDISMKLIVNDDKKVTIDGIKDVYKSLGIECDE